MRDSEVESEFENPLDKPMVRSAENTPSKAGMRAKLIRAVTVIKKIKGSEVEE